MVIFLYGEDFFRSRQKVNEIKEKYLQSDKSGSGLSSFDAEEVASIAQRIKSVFGTNNLFSSKRLLICNNLITLGPEKEQEEVLSYLKENKSRAEDKDLVAVFWEGGNPKKNNSLFKFLEKSAKKQNFEKLSGPRLNQWILRKMKEADPRAQISPKALEKLVAYTSSDSGTLDKEIQKLVNYSDGKMVSEKEVDILVKASLDSNIFKTVDALGSNNKREVVKLIQNHLENGDDPFYLMTMFAYQFRNMLKVADLKEKGVSEYEMSRVAKMHPFVIKKSLSQMRALSFSRVKKMYEKLGAIDLMVKTGKMDIKLALTKLVAEL